MKISPFPGVCAYCVIHDLPHYNRARADASCWLELDLSAYEDKARVFLTEGGLRARYMIITLCDMEGQYHGYGDMNGRYAKDLLAYGFTIMDGPRENPITGNNIFTYIKKISPKKDATKTKSVVRTRPVESVIVDDCEEDDS